jgi:hypothetical protein
LHVEEQRVIRADGEPAGLVDLVRVLVLGVSHEELLPEGGVSGQLEEGLRDNGYGGPAH